MVTLIYYWKKKFITGKKCVSCEGPPPIANIRRFRVTFDKFMSKDYQIIGYEK